MALDRKQTPNDLNAFWMPFTANRQFKKAPRMFVAAKDMHYTTSDGRQVLDGTAGLWCCNAGHCRPKITEAIQKQALQIYQQSIQSAFRDVENALVASSKSRERMAYQARQVEALSTYAHYARLRYDNGYTSYIEVLDAERSLFDAELDYTRTRGSVFTNMIDLYKATGGGWVTEADKLTATANQKRP